GSVAKGLHREDEQTGAQIPTAGQGSTVAQKSIYIGSICDCLNATPRKCPGYRIPAEAVRDELMKLEP
ncbi:MAG: hypothetical protein ABJG14_17760, partial [Sulfitobacter sp.]